ncbi:MAG TPA: hypothetical protein VL921_02480 [Candidatus Udaeobacter sp.]|nr:hypothetical protein [Candidatus Udaeobacter sp.]
MTATLGLSSRLNLAAIAPLVEPAKLAAIAPLIEQANLAATPGLLPSILPTLARGNGGDAL